MEAQTPVEGSSNTEKAMLAITLANQLNSPLLRLPGEIRNIIYDYLSTSSTITLAFTRTWPSPPPSCYVFVPPPFLSTCTQIHYEARHLVYTRGTFDVSRLSTMSFLFSSPANPRICRQMTRLRISHFIVNVVMQERFRHTEKGDKKSLARKVVLDSLPAVKELCVVDGRGLGEEVMEKARQWFKKEGMEITFE
ncbi:hypothetical protein ACET3X_003727 [Alternaria dauci]|uniref:F-box domain-containing protein n=1 Tax=Alternaria dauci TaxID=48095 RepID=A0ABR3UNN0_9PLEO